MERQCGVGDRQRNGIVKGEGCLLGGYTALTPGMSGVGIQVVAAGARDTMATSGGAVCWSRSAATASSPAGSSCLLASVVRIATGRQWRNIALTSMLYHGIALTASRRKALKGGTLRAGRLSSLKHICSGEEVKCDSRAS
jgi:hypothetical protein